MHHDDTDAATPPIDEATFRGDETVDPLDSHETVSDQPETSDAYEVWPDQDGTPAPQQIDVREMSFFKKLDPRIQQEIGLALTYIGVFNHGTPGHLSYQTIVELVTACARSEATLAYLATKLEPANKPASA